MNTKDNNNKTASGAPEEAPAWKRVLDRRLPNLCVLYSGKKPLGFIYKLADTTTGKSQWCCNIGCGDTAKLVSHQWTIEEAKLAIEENVNT